MAQFSNSDEADLLLFFGLAGDVRYSPGQFLLKTAACLPASSQASVSQCDIGSE